jgi:hypothetical protein
MLPYSVLPELVEVIEAQWKVHEALKKQNVICPWVFNRDGEPILEFRGRGGTRARPLAALAASHMISGGRRFAISSAPAFRAAWR